MADEQHLAELTAYYRSLGRTEAHARQLATLNAEKPLAACLGDAAPILARLMAGDNAKQVASDLGISDTALFSWLIRTCPEEWNAIQSGRALSRFTDCEERLDAATDQVQIGKARESARLASWTLERAARKMYGQQNEPGNGLVINVNVDRSCNGQIPGVTIEHGQD